MRGAAAPAGLPCDPPPAKKVFTGRRNTAGPPPCEIFSPRGFWTACPIWAQGGGRWRTG
uniref:Uncharacterized protein n=1 Tax=Siphoviridae sp. ct4fm14 TaxID=2825331 RepID=A0A8S5UT17_9CAUD|nr:MAG TPA: hypothetical protein [Siphoviridae sp. ct4fm14]